MIRPLVYHGEPVLHNPSQEVSVIDNSVRELIADLADTLYSTSGVGLAAPQIGVNKRVFVYDAHRVAGRRNFQALINPRITSREGSLVSEGEGCLSAPGLEVDVPRAAAVHVEGLDAEGKPVSFEAKDFHAIVIQHEVDHLDGRLLSDRVEGERRTEFERLLALVVAQHTSARYIENLRAIQRRLDSTAQRPDGILYTQRKTGHDVVVEKAGNFVELSVRAQGSDAENVVARLHLLAPLDLVQLETQAMMLSLLWVPEPSLICLVGFGGGRLPMVFLQHYPAVKIDAVESDADMILLARKFFGVQPNDHLHVIAAEGREYFDRLGDVKYDAILLDRHSAGASDSYGMWTREFYEICKSHLVDGGVVAKTFSDQESLSEEKAATFTAAFEHIFQFRADTSRIVFGSNVIFDLANALEHVKQHYVPHNFTMSELAANLSPLSTLQTGTASGILRDADRQKLVHDLAPGDLLFRKVGRNTPCPCGSGKKYKNCHGRA